MHSFPFIDIHSHSPSDDKTTVYVQNIFPGDNFGAFNGRNFYSVGLHPWFIKSKEENNKSLSMVEEALSVDHVIFAGECGLDKIAKTDFPEQVRVFKAQAFIAEEFNTPLLIHCVKAYSEMLEIYKQMKPVQPWILHGYSGNIQTTRQLLQENFFFSFGNILFNSNAKAVKSFAIVPRDRIFLETDESLNDISAIYEQGARLKSVSIQRLKELIWKNFNRLENVKFSGIFFLLFLIF
ncbi:MAG: TatD family hydrolase [Prolixibacteraceae bacterium]|nr:TatD family hydrolase [Prolixibacteraceae bacterium]